MKSSRRPAQRDYSTFFLGGILLGIVIIVFGIMLAFSQARGRALSPRDIDDQSSRSQRSSSFGMIGTGYIFGSMERNRIG